MRLNGWMAAAWTALGDRTSGGRRRRWRRQHAIRRPQPPRCPDGRSRPTHGNELSLECPPGCLDDSPGVVARSAGGLPRVEAGALGHGRVDRRGPSCDADRRGVRLGGLARDGSSADVGADGAGDQLVATGASASAADRPVDPLGRAASVATVPQRTAHHGDEPEHQRKRRARFRAHRARPNRASRPPG